MDSNKLRLNTICRACLSEGTNMIPLFDRTEDNRTLFEILAFIINIDISNKYPQQVCEECYKLIRKTDKFKQICLKSDNILKSMIKDGNVVPNSDRVKLEVVDKPRLLYQCAVCLEKFATGTSLESHVFNHVGSTNSRDFQDYNHTSHSSTDRNTLVVTKTNMKQEYIELRPNYTHNEHENNFLEVSSSRPLHYKQEDKIMECSKCGSQYNENDFKTHIQNCKNVIPLQEEVNNVEWSAKYEVSACELTLSPINLKSQKNEHNDKKKIYQCPICKRSYRRKNSYMLHLRTHKSSDDLNYCKQEFQDQTHLDNLLAKHCKFHCKTCNIYFPTKECLKNHKTSHKLKRNQCELCHKTFKKRWFLNQHMMTHTGERRFLCSLCGKRFTQKYNLDLHMRRHQGFKEIFICDTCNKRLGTKVALIRHIRLLHSGVIPSFVCEDCGKRFTSSIKLVKHRRLHRTDRPHGCDLCSMRFLTKWTLKRHQKAHSGDRPHQCSLCNKSFVRRYDVEHHKPCHSSKDLAINRPHNPP